MYVFGSATTGKRTPRSDFNFLVRFRDIPFDRYTENYFRLHYAIEALLGAPIDLLTEPSIKNPIFKAEVDKTKTEIYPNIDLNVQLKLL